MTPADWITSGIGLAMLYGIINVVRVLTQIRTTLKHHVEENDRDHARINKRLDRHEGRLDGHEERLRGVEGGG